MEKKSSLFVIAGYIYLVLPVLIFFIGWCNPFIAALGLLIIGLSTYFLIKNSPKLWIPADKKEWFILCAAGIICLLWTCSSGIGALVFQNSDHTARNAIFEYLVNMDWPVVFKEDSLMLVYYIGFWLPSAVAGKLLDSVQAGYIFQVFWAFSGVFLTMYYILSGLKKKTLFPLIIFIFFSGLDYIGSVALLGFQKHNPFELTSHLEWWLPGFQFSSFTTQLYWVFNQAIPAWVVTMLILKEKNNKSIIFLYSCLLLSATLPAIGMLPIVAYIMLKNGENDLKMLLSVSHIFNSIKTAFSFPNIIGGLFVAIVSYAYLSGNMSGTVCYSLFFPAFMFILWLFSFFLLEVGLYILLVCRQKYKEPLFYICILVFLIYPFFHIGHAADFCMRATIPALIILYLFIVEVFDNNDFKKNKISYIVIILVLAIGSITPIHEMARTIVNTSKGIIKAPCILNGDNFYGLLTNNKFLMTFGKKIKN